MAETSALWVDHLLPAVPYRQFVLSFDGPMAVRLGYDAGLLGNVCRAFAHRVRQCVRRRVKQHHRCTTLARLHPGVVTVVQRFRADLGLYVHLHCLVTDGAFEDPKTPDLSPVFLPAPELCDDDLVALLRRLARDLPGAHEDDPDVDPGVVACVQLALSTPVAGPSAVAGPARLNVHAFGMNLHAATTADGRDRKQLHRLARYLLRPPFAHNAVTWLPDGRVRLDIARRHRAVRMTPEQFIARLIALVPAPGVHMIRYAGVFANRHHLRRRVGPPAVDAPVVPTQLALLDRHGQRPAPVRADDPPSRPPRIGWARLLARVFAIDVLACPRCDGRLVATAAVLDTQEIAALLHGARGPPRPSPPGQLELLS